MLLVLLLLYCLAAIAIVGIGSLIVLGSLAFWTFGVKDDTIISEPEPKQDSRWLLLQRVMQVDKGLLRRP